MFIKGVVAFAAALLFDRKLGEISYQIKALRANDAHSHEKK